jgi:PAS domain-containing protein
MNRLEDSDQVMIDSMPTMAWRCRPDGFVEFLNQRWLDYTGLSPDEAVGWGWNAAIEPSGSRIDTLPAAAVRRGPGGIGFVELLNRTPKRPSAWLRSRAAHPMKTRDDVRVSVRKNVANMERAADG